MSDRNKPLIWLKGEVKTPPFSQTARIEAGYLLRRLQQGKTIGMPHSRPMQSIGSNCHELRIRDREQNWRIIYRIDQNAIIIVEVFSKKSQATPQSTINICKQRLSKYDKDRQE